MDKVQGSRRAKEEEGDVPPLQAQIDDWGDLERLVKAHRFTCNRNRTNLGGPCVWYGQRRCLKTGVYSNTRKQGPILEHVRRMLGEDVSAVTLNRNVHCGVHRDRKNATRFRICSMGDFEGGALCLEDGRRFNEKRQWFTFDGAEVNHRNEPITAGRKNSVVAYTQRGAFEQLEL